MSAHASLCHLISKAICLEDHHVQSGECRKCPAGTSRAAGDHTDSADTPCGGFCGTKYDCSKQKSNTTRKLICYTSAHQDGLRRRTSGPPSPNTRTASPCVAHTLKRHRI